jgi:DNA-directed RNA polymerase specialized sigma24 family protein
MAPDESVSQWLCQLQAGDRLAAQKLCERYLQRLVALARRKLHGRPRPAGDEEDVALSAFDSFCRGAERGRFPELHDRYGLWRLLVTITVRKARQLRENEERQKRGGKASWRAAAHARPRAHGTGQAGLEQFLDQHPTPQFAAQVAEAYQRLLACLPDSELRAVAQWKMEAYTNAEIAAKLGCVPRTVERRLRVIRSFWEQEARP